MPQIYPIYFFTVVILMDPKAHGANASAHISKQHEVILQEGPVRGDESSEKEIF
jgi:hypothetical protein